jgi:hypothetical protein
VVREQSARRSRDGYREFQAALDLLVPAFEKSLHIEFLNWAKVDPDLDLVRDHARFKAMIAKAAARLAQS